MSKLKPFIVMKALFIIFTFVFCADKLEARKDLLSFCLDKLGQTGSHDAHVVAEIENSASGSQFDVQQTAQLLKAFNSKEFVEREDVAILVRGVVPLLAKDQGLTANQKADIWDRVATDIKLKPKGYVWRSERTLIDNGSILLEGVNRPLVQNIQPVLPQNTIAFIGSDHGLLITPDGKIRTVSVSYESNGNYIFFNDSRAAPPER